MSNNSRDIVKKVWSYCDVLRDEGVSYGDYVEQLTYLLFLKMADEQTKPPYNNPSKIPKKWDWQQLSSKKGDELEIQYRHSLENLGKEEGVLGVIFRKSENKLRDPAKLKRLVDLIDGEKWTGIDVDVKGSIYEGLLEKNASDVKSGAGQYFTPRPLIQAIVDVMQPKPDTTIADPACGTGGFILAAADYISKNYKLDEGQKKFLRDEAFWGCDIVYDVVRLCTMNLFLHGIALDNPIIIEDDSLLGEPAVHYDMVLTNPPFGRKSSYTLTIKDGKAVKESASYERQDFWATSSNKQLNFLQHAVSMLEINGTAAIVVPDNVLFEAGSGEIVRKNLLDNCDVHTLLRLPTGIFYSGGVKANVLFFDKKPASETHWTKTLWIYDLRTNKHFTQKENTLKREDLDEFVQCYNPKNRLKRKEIERFQPRTYDELIKRDNLNLDIIWIEDDSLENIENLPPPDIIAQEIADNLESALDSVNELIVSLGKK